MSGNLLAELGYDLDDPAVAAATEDAERLVRLIATLRRLRDQAGLNQSNVAERMGTSQSVVSHLERVGGDPRLSQLQRYARAVNHRLAFAPAAATVWSPVGHVRVVGSDDIDDESRDRNGSDLSFAGARWQTPSAKDVDTRRSSA